MTYLGKNIKKIRTIQKLSQASFGEIFGLSRASIGAYEEGRAEAKLDVIIKIANHFSITVDNLVNRDITVNELAHFNIFDQSIGEKISIGNEMLKNIAFYDIPVIFSSDLLLKNLDECKTNSTNTIRLPFHVEKHLAIIIDRDNYLHIAKRISSNDIVVVLLDLDLWKEAELENRFWFVKSGNSLFLGEIKLSKNNGIFFFPENEKPVTIANNKIDFIFPVDTHISNKPEISSAESGKLKQMELKITDLYNRL